MLITAIIVALVSGCLRSQLPLLIAGVLMFVALTGCAGAKASIDAKQEPHKPVSVSAHYEWTFTR